jgi:thioredoxin reductase (NADPH)
MPDHVEHEIAGRALRVGRPQYHLGTERAKVEPFVSLRHLSSSTVGRAALAPGARRPGAMRAGSSVADAPASAKWPTRIGSAIDAAPELHRHCTAKAQVGRFVDGSDAARADHLSQPLATRQDPLAVRRPSSRRKPQTVGRQPRPSVTSTSIGHGMGTTASPAGGLPMRCPALAARLQCRRRGGHPRGGAAGMVTAEEVGRIGVFASLEAGVLERLARAAADITLLPGEYAAHKGDERALFALLDGGIEAVAIVDGVERVVGRREPGDIFGEVPIVLGAPFPVGFRAAATSRIMRIEPHDYHAVASVAPDVAKEVGRLAGHRMSGPRGLQGIASEQPAPRAIVLGHRWDSACADLRRFLDRNQISFTWVPTDAPDAAEQWGGPLPPEHGGPAIRGIGGETLLRPGLREAANMLGIATEAKGTEYDTVIVGAGPAGLAAAVYGASEGLRTIVVEREAPGGQAGTSSRIENYLGFPSGVSGDELASRALQQAHRLGAEILVTRRVLGIDPPTRELRLDGGDVLRARTLILACGVAWRRLPIDGFERLAGRGISYGAARSEAANSHGLDIHVVGAGNSAGQAALFFSNHASSVTIVCRGESLAKSMSRYLLDQIAARPSIGTRLRSEVVAAHGGGSLEAIDIRAAGTGEVERVPSDALFIFIGADAQTSWLPAEIARDDRGYVLTGADMRAVARWPLNRDPYLLETSVPGVFACGDVRYGPVKRVAAAVGEGSMAIAFVHQYLGDAGAGG